MSDAAVDHDGRRTEIQPKLVKRVDMERNRRFNQCAGTTELFDRDRLDDGGGAFQVAKDFDALGAALLVGHSGAEL
jgi:hypothetical protein